MYEDWEALADDLFADWGMRFVRDVYMRLVDERVRQAIRPSNPFGNQSQVHLIGR